MKKLMVMTALLLSGLVFQSASAQLRVSLNVNIGSQPVWGPVGYSHVEYYYMPDIDVYYYVPRQQYVYMDRGSWIFSASLPYRYNYYNIYSGYKVVINEPTPYRNAQVYRTRYASYKGNRSQKTIRDSRDSRYYQIKEHPEHNRWQQDQDRRRQPDQGRDNRDNRDNNNKNNQKKGKN